MRALPRIAAFLGTSRGPGEDALAVRQPRLLEARVVGAPRPETCAGQAPASPQHARRSSRGFGWAYCPPEPAQNTASLSPAPAQSSSADPAPPFAMSRKKIRSPGFQCARSFRRVLLSRQLQTSRSWAKPP
eukprot:scaffold7059_cov250-Pinguiococcus_pyrenoidosus.AAC.16